MTELVFLPGWSFGPYIWNRQQVLSDSYPCHFIDPEIIWQQVKDSSGSPGLTQVISTLTKLITSMKNPVIIGWSLGSLLALEIALKAGQQSIRGLILTGATARFTTATGYTGGLPEVIVKRMQRKLKADRNSTLTNFNDFIFTEAEKNTGFLLEISALQRENSVSTSLDFLQAGLDYLLNIDLRGDITKTGGYWPPVLLLHGRKDTICPLNGAKTLAKLLTVAGSEVDLGEIPEAGHAPFFTKAEGFNMIVENFLQKQVSGCD